MSRSPHQTIQRNQVTCGGFVMCPDDFDLEMRDSFLDNLEREQDWNRFMLAQNLIPASWVEDWLPEDWIE